jgi:hypothetical protein
VLSVNHEKVPLPDGQWVVASQEERGGGSDLVPSGVEVGPRPGAEFSQIVIVSEPVEPLDFGPSVSVSEASAHG